MFLVYLDEFGHAGPYVASDHPQHNTSPVFGYAGFALPAEKARSFSSFFLQLKSNLLQVEISASGKPVHRWEKKGASLFRRNSLNRYPHVRQAAFRVAGEVAKRGGFVFFYGREKFRDRVDLNPVGLQKTVLSHAIRRLDGGMRARSEHFALIMDENSANIALLETAQKTMFGGQPCRCLVSAPFEVASHLDQCIQAADWIAAIVGRVWALRVDPCGFSDYAAYETYFGERVLNAAQHSCLLRRDRVR